jgi:hypothetical protein
MGNYDDFYHVMGAYRQMYLADYYDLSCQKEKIK